MRTPSFTLLLAIIGPLGLAAYDRAPGRAAGPRYSDAPIERADPVCSFAVHPLHHPQKLSEACDPLVDYLNAGSPALSARGLTRLLDL